MSLTNCFPCTEDLSMSEQTINLLFEILGAIRLCKMKKSNECLIT